MKKKCNTRVRIAMLTYGIKQYELANMLGYTGEHMSRLLSYELPDEKQDYIISVMKKKAERSS